MPTPRTVTCTECAGFGGTRGTRRKATAVAVRDEAPTDLGEIQSALDSIRARPAGLVIRQLSALWRERLLSRGQRRYIAERLGHNNDTIKYIEGELELWAKLIERSEFDEGHERALAQQRKQASLVAEQTKLTEEQIKLAEKQAKLREIQEESDKESARRQRDVRALDNPPRSKGDARREAYRNMARYGAKGRHSIMAEEVIADLIAERGGEENLTDEDRENIARARHQAAYDDSESR
ncbi:hypothetical protein [Microbaculum sp. FT89]|uniref:hypothetical protein n=1 Tax=Microbaculum sp. FT89 TaxID=3447298 RepID=UPI003F53260D